MLAETRRHAGIGKAMMTKTMLGRREEGMCWEAKAPISCKQLLAKPLQGP